VTAVPAMFDMPSSDAPSFDWRVLAHVDAALNALAFVCICAGLVAIKRGNVTLHKRLMLTALGLSTAFLCCYVLYHLNAEPVRFRGEGWQLTAYRVLLFSHIVLAAVQVPLILRTAWLGLKDRRAQHKKWAKVTTPIWLYVSLTGVIVYALLYHWPA
jgi:putative membrane protein